MLHTCSSPVALLHCCMREGNGFAERPRCAWHTRRVQERRGAWSCPDSRLGAVGLSRLPLRRAWPCVDRPTDLIGCANRSGGADAHEGDHKGLRRRDQRLRRRVRPRTPIQRNPPAPAGAGRALPRLRRFGVCIDDILARKNVKTSKLLVRPLERSGAHPRQCFLPSGVPRRSSG